MFDFSNWKPSSEYESIDKFYRDTILSCYRIERKSLDWAVLRQLVAEGRVYLFQIYSQNFSPNAHGTENLHTMYFKMIFDEKLPMTDQAKLFAEDPQDPATLFGYFLQKSAPPSIMTSSRTSVLRKISIFCTCRLH